MKKSAVQRIKDFFLGMIVMGLVVVGMGWTGYMESTYSVDGLVIDKDADEWMWRVWTRHLLWPGAWHLV